MAKAKKLKVFRTPIGFHDAYVAVPSKKAALEAWGSATDLFAAGAAELVTDPALARPALAKPGEVIRVARGTDAEHVRALGAAKEGKPSPQPSPARGRGRKRPSSSAVDRAEQAIEVVDARLKAALDRLRAEEQALERRRQTLEKSHRGERKRLELALDQARAKYRAALADWAG